MKKQNEIKSKSVIRREAVQNKVKCETCDGKQLILVDHVGLVHPEYEPCPDCTTSQPSDEEIREVFCQTIPEYKLGIPVETLFNIEEFKTALYHFSNGYTSQSAKLKQQADEIEELQEENNSLSVSIRKVTDERDTLSSLLSEAVEGLKVCREDVSIVVTKYDKERKDSISSTLKKLAQFIGD